VGINGIYYFYDKCKKYLFCSWAHRKHLCYPEVWGRGLKGPWHCAKCHECGEWIDMLTETWRGDLINGKEEGQPKL
jgi:hypothetical protein